MAEKTTQAEARLSNLRVDFLQVRLIAVSYVMLTSSEAPYGSGKVVFFPFQNRVARKFKLQPLILVPNSRFSLLRQHVSGVSRAWGRRERPQWRHHPSPGCVDIY